MTGPASKAISDNNSIVAAGSYRRGGVFPRVRTPVFLAPGRTIGSTPRASHCGKGLMELIKLMAGLTGRSMVTSEKEPISNKGGVVRIA